MLPHDMAGEWFWLMAEKIIETIGVMMMIWIVMTWAMVKILGPKAWRFSNAMAGSILKNLHRVCPSVLTLILAGFLVKMWDDAWVQQVLHAHAWLLWGVLLGWTCVMLDVALTCLKWATETDGATQAPSNQ